MYSHSNFKNPGMSDWIRWITNASHEIKSLNCFNFKLLKNKVLKTLLTFQYLLKYCFIIILHLKIKKIINENMLTKLLFVDIYRTSLEIFGLKNLYLF